MKAIKGCTKEQYKEELAGGVIKEFETIQEAAKYLAGKYNSTVEYMERSIADDTNCDAIYFEDGSVLLCEFSD